jgi:hypothetical protein
MMKIRVIDRKPFRQGGDVEGVVGGNQCHRGETSILLIMVDFESGGELHGVIGTQRMGIRQPHGLVEQSGRNLDDGVATGQVLTESAKDRRRLGGSERLAFPSGSETGTRGVKPGRGQLFIPQQLIASLFPSRAEIEVSAPGPVQG